MPKKPRALVTSGATRERIDPVRYISNDSSGKQGYAIAAALTKQGFDVTLVSGFATAQAPEDVNIVRVETAEEMLQACKKTLPVDVAVCVAAVADWRPEVVSASKIKKIEGEDRLSINFVKTPDILAFISEHDNRPKLVIGFAAETENLIENAQSKLSRKGCDWIVANDVSKDSFGSNDNQISIIMSDSSVENMLRMPKSKIAEKLVDKIINYIKI